MTTKSMIGMVIAASPDPNRISSFPTNLTIPTPSAEIDAPPVITSASPRAMFIMPSVLMNGCGRCRRVSSRPLTTPKPGTDRERGQHPDRLVHAGLRDDHRQDAHREREHGAHREVDPAGQDHDQEAQREERVDRRLAGDPGQVAGGQERRRRDREDDHQDDQAEQRPEPEGDVGPVPTLFVGRGRGEGLRLRRHAPAPSRRPGSAPGSSRRPPARQRCCRRA